MEKAGDILYPYGICSYSAPITHEFYNNLKLLWLIYQPKRGKMEYLF